MQVRRAVGAVAVTALMAGCTASGVVAQGPSAPVTAAPSTAPTTVTVYAYARDVCWAIDTWYADISDRAEAFAARTFPDSPVQRKRLLVRYLDRLLTDTNRMVARVGAAGVPEIADGEDAADLLLTSMRRTRDIVAETRDRVRSVSTANPARWATRSMRALTSMEEATMDAVAGLVELKNPELDAMAGSVSECEPVFDIAGGGDTATLTA